MVVRARALDRLVDQREIARARVAHFFSAHTVCQEGFTSSCISCGTPVFVYPWYHGLIARGYANNREIAKVSDPKITLALLHFVQQCHECHMSIVKLFPVFLDQGGRESFEVSLDVLNCLRKILNAI